MVMTTKEKDSFTRWMIVTLKCTTRAESSGLCDPYLWWIVLHLTFRFPKSKATSRDCALKENILSKCQHFWRHLKTLDFKLWTLLIQPLIKRDIKNVTIQRPTLPLDKNKDIYFWHRCLRNTVLLGKVSCSWNARTS